VIDLPSYLTSFDPDQNGCDINAAFCCWVQDRQANDNNGNCNTPYESQCIDKDPGDNANFCYTDHTRSDANTQGGFSVFGDVLNGKENIEGAIHCHGFAWAQDELDTSAVYKGNNLFYVSLYDHMHQRGYVRNAPGSTMCGCSENMAVVTRADCTEISAEQTFRFDYNTANSAFQGVLITNDLDFNACQGANNNNNDLEAYYTRLVNEGKQTTSNLAELRKTLVGTAAGKCNQAIVDFMETKGIVRDTSSAAAADVGPEMIPMDDGIAAAESVEVVDPDYVYENNSNMGDGYEMPDVPNDPASDFYEEGTVDEQEAVDDEKYEDDKPEAANQEEDDEEAEDDDLSEGLDNLRENGKACRLDGQCSSGKCNVRCVEAEDVVSIGVVVVDDSSSTGEKGGEKGGGLKA